MRAAVAATTQNVCCVIIGGSCRAGLSSSPFLFRLCCVSATLNVACFCWLSVFLRFRTLLPGCLSALKPVLYTLHVMRKLNSFRYRTMITFGPKTSVRTAKTRGERDTGRRPTQPSRCATKLVALAFWHPFLGDDPINYSSCCHYSTDMK